MSGKSIDDLTLVLIPAHGVLRLCPKVQLSGEGRDGKRFLSEKQKHQTLEGILETSKISVNEVLKYEVKDNDFLPDSLDTRNYLVRPGLSARRFLVQWVRQLGEDEIVKIFSMSKSLSSLSSSKYSSLLNYDHHLEETDFELENENTLKLHRSLSVPAEIWFIESNEVADKVKEDDSEDESVSPESFFESVVPPNSTQPTCSFNMEPQNAMYEIPHILDELTNDVNANELMELSSQERDQLIQPNDFHINTLESDERNDLSPTIQAKESPLGSVHYNEEISSHSMVDIQYSSDNIMNNTQTSLVRDVSNTNIESFCSYDDNVFLSDAHDNDNYKRLEQDNDQLQVDVDGNESLEQKDYMLTEKVNSNYMPNTRNYTLKSFELTVPPPNVTTSKLPVLSRTKTLPIIKRKYKKTSISSSIKVYIQGKCVISDDDYSIPKETTPKLPPIVSPNQYQQSFIQANRNDKKESDKLKQNSVGNNNRGDNDVLVDDDNEIEGNMITGVEHSLSFNTPVRFSFESLDKLPYITDSNENKVASSTFNIKTGAPNHDKHFENHGYLNDDLQGLLEHENDDVMLKPINVTNNQRQSIINNLEPLIPLRETRSNSMMFETSVKKYIPLTFSKIGSNWHNKASHSHKDVQFAFVPINQSDLPVYSVNERIKRPAESRSERSTVRKQPIGQLEQANAKLELPVSASLRKVKQLIKENLVKPTETIKRALKPRTNPEDFCMTMWSYQEVKHEEVPLPELLTVLLSGKPDLILKRVFGEIHPERNLAQELRTAIETIYRVLPKSHAFGSIANLIGMRPGYKLEVQILKPGHTHKEYKNILINTLRDAFKHSTIQQVISNQQNHDLEKLILQIAEVCSIITTELIGTDTLKHTKHFTGLNLETLIMNLVKGAIYETPLANHGVLSGLLAAAGGGIEALMGLLASVGSGVGGLSKLLATGANPPDALGELLRGLNDDPVTALKNLANTMGGGVDGIKNILDALGGDNQHALQELIKQVGDGAVGIKNLFEAAGGIKELMGSLFGEGSGGLADLVAAVGGDLEGLKNLIQAAGGEVGGIRNLIALGGDEVTGLSNLLSAVGGDTVADALSTLIKAAGGIKDGLAALLQESGGGAKGLENLIGAVGDGVDGLKNLLKATGDGPVEGLGNILAGAGGGAEGLKNLLKAVGGEAEGLKNLLNVMGDNPDEALANILKAAGGGTEALKNLLECIGGGVEGLQTLLQSLGGDHVHALTNFIASVGGVEEGLRNFIDAVGGNVAGVSNLLKSMGGSTKEAFDVLLTASGGGIEGLTNLIAAAGAGSEGVTDLIAAAGGGASGLKNLFDAVGGGVQGLTNLLSAFGGDMSEALLNLLNVTGDQKEDLKNLIGSLGGSDEGLENLLKVIGDKVGIDGLFKTLGGGARGLATLLNSFEGNKEDAIRKLLEVSGGGVKGLAALLESAGGGIEAITEIINAFGGGHEALAKLLSSCGDNPADAIRVLLEMLGGDENALRDLLLASGVDANDPSSLKSLFEALDGADAGLGILVSAMGGGEEGMKKLLKTFGDDGLAHLIVAAGGEDGIVALIKAMGGGVEGLTVLIDLLGGKENGIATLITAAGGGQAGLAALLEAAGKFAQDGVGLEALVAAVGGGAEGLEALINAAGGDGEGLNDILLAAGATDASSKASILKSLVSSGGGGQEGFNNVLKILARGRNNKPIDGLASLVKVLGSNPDTLEIVLEAIGGNTDGLADILAAAGGGAEAMQLLIDVAGGGAEGLVKLLESAKLDNLQQLADVLAAAGLSDDIVSAARSGNLSELSGLIVRNAEEENYLRMRIGKPKELCREEKEWLRTRPTGPISFRRKLTTTRRSYRKWKESSEIASSAQQEFDLTVLPTFSQSTMESSVLNLYSYQQCCQDKLNKFASQLNSNILESLKAKIIHLDRKIDSDVKETDLFYENQFLEEERLRQDDNQFIDPLNLLSFNEEEHRREEEMLLESKRLIEAFDEHVKMRKRLRDEEILTKYMMNSQDQGEIVIPEDIQHVIDNISLHKTESFEEALTEVVEEDKEIMEETLEELSKTTRIQSQLLVVHDLLRESIGLERNSKITPAFVWSYFELLRSMGHHLQSSVPLGQENNEQIYH
ncbi:hypothetical protein MN116_008644 [Schistosoma mekongi]|uniref:Uncharacterized protein n=1 Tax=Schistosoma mekongi TaxID=38744 RepID=A0AAE2D1I5_SCHME|nr:hypothetical protein MN116_008644 [Schistosoma mekongi]